MSENTRVIDLVEALRAYFATCDGAQEPVRGGLSTVRQRLVETRSIWFGGTVDGTVFPEPKCGHLDQALDLAEASVSGHPAASQVIEALGAARPHLNWVSYTAYDPEEIGPDFPGRHAFASLVWPFDPGYARDFDLGFLLIAPDTLYRDHQHPAPELYVPLTEPSRWRFGGKADWQERAAHDAIWNPPMTIHATSVGAQPLLAIYVWTRDVNLPAAVCRMADWTGPGSTRGAASG